jgi:hypothetical protein
MVMLTISIDDATARRLKQAAQQRGTTVDELLAAGAHLLLDAGAAPLTQKASEATSSATKRR